jgi:Na+/H+-translocating membrane pyrophosphatase
VASIIRQALCLLRHYPHLDPRVLSYLAFYDVASIIRQALAIGKGFAIGSAALVSLALTAAFVTRTTVLERGVNILNPVVFAFLLIGSMLPYW